MKALFLDIDGVVQAGIDQERFSHVDEMVELSKRLTKELNNGFDYFKYGGESPDDRFPPTEQYDIAAVYYDWRPEVIARLRTILDTTGAMIVLSSDWREKGLYNMKGLLNIHGLGKYLYNTSTFYLANWKPYVQELYTVEELLEMSDDTNLIMDTLCGKMDEYYKTKVESSRSINSRAVEIREYLDRHTEITSYVVLDDLNLSYGLDGHFVRTSGFIMEDQVEQIIDILNCEDGPYPLPQSTKTPELEQWRRKWVYTCRYNSAS